MAATISVVIPAFNCARWIANAIHSVQAQSRPVDEIIVVDDGSTDNLRDIVRAPVHYVRHEVNRGLCAARNSGVRAATGDYLVFLDADDTLVPDAIEKMLRAMETTAASWCITDLYRIEQDQTFLWRCHPSDDDPLVAILANDFVMRGFFFRRTDFEEIGMYDETLRAREDWDINIRMIRAGKLFCYVAEPLYRYYRREGSITTGSSADFLACTKRILDNHHRGMASKGDKFNRAYAAALWLLGSMHWAANHRFTAVYYGASSALRARSFHNVARFLRRIIGRNAVPD